MKSRRVHLLAVLVCAVIVHAGVAIAAEGAESAPSTMPAAESGLIVRKGESKTVGASASTTAPASRGDGDVAGSSNSSGMSPTVRVVVALGAVIGLIVMLKYGAGTMLGMKGAGPKANKGVRVLSRTMMGHRQQLVLLQVGRKLVLVADSAGTVSTVTEIDDPDEVAELAGQALGSAVVLSDGGSEKAGGMAAGMSKAFGGMFQRQSLPYQGAAKRGETSVQGDREEDVTEAEAEPRNQGSSSEEDVDLAGLAERVRRLNRQFH